MLNFLSAWVYYEKDIHVNTNNHDPNLQWKWQSFEHQNLSLVGIIIGGAVEHTLISANPVIGQYHAVMDLKVSLKYSVGFKGSPCSSELVYPCNKMFNVND